MPPTADFVHPFAEVAMSNITREYPFASHHLAWSLADIVPAVEKHPAFANSYDWHSSVHMHYLLASLLETEAARSTDWRERAIEILSSHLSEENMLAEAAFLRENPSWERPYGWAWAVELNRVLNASGVAELRALGKNTQVLGETVFDLVTAWLPKVAEPVRHGVHSNTAFGLRRILIGARIADLHDAVDTIAGAARRFFAEDTAWNFRQERSGHDFLSPGLCEADLIAEVFTEDELATWLPGFLSELSPESPALTPVKVLDPTDGQQSHLYGLGLSVAASVMRLAPKLEAIAEKSGDEDLHAQAKGMLTRVDSLMAPGLEAAISDEYVSSHWIATFAWEALRLNLPVS
ncbi:hypothetical protein GCM10010974_19370 [Brevibacterium sediminis]|uniref:DUF2891 family protein n=1 Tax=Brevibacterium sediminis TaxID=1857024 RepID=A0ABQ1ME32_9MICO|nr:DUF2891 family protein [Brevibacterium sediminis]GGC37091.1 hypothetical protein GCM10010974_19370 [Brevibacterium sediminis]